MDFDMDGLQEMFDRREACRRQQEELIPQVVAAIKKKYGVTVNEHDVYGHIVKRQEDGDWPISRNQANVDELAAICAEPLGLISVQQSLDDQINEATRRIVALCEGMVPDNVVHDSLVAINNKKSISPIQPRKLEDLAFALKQRWHDYTMTHPSSAQPSSNQPPNYGDDKLNDYVFRNLMGDCTSALTPLKARIDNLKRYRESSDYYQSKYFPFMRAVSEAASGTPDVDVVEAVVASRHSELENCGLDGALVQEMATEVDSIMKNLRASTVKRPDPTSDMLKEVEPNLRKNLLQYLYGNTDEMVVFQDRVQSAIWYFSQPESVQKEYYHHMGKVEEEWKRIRQTDLDDDIIEYQVASYIQTGTLDRGGYSEVAAECEIIYRKLHGNWR